MNIPFFRPCVGDRTVDYAKAAVESVWWSGGHGGYQDLLAHHLKQIYAYDYCLLVNSGTSACRAALAAAKQKHPERDRVTVPMYSCEANISPVWEQRMEPVFMTTGPDGNPFVDDFSDVVNMETISAMFLPYIYGEVPIGLDSYQDICYFSGTSLIADISQAVGLGHEYVKGDMVVGSLRTEKFLGCGEGGFLLTNDPNLYLWAKRFCEWGRVSRSTPYTCTSYGNNLLMPGVAAATAYGQLDVLVDIRMNKLDAAMMYRNSDVFEERGYFLDRELTSTGIPKYVPWQTMFINENVLAADVIRVMEENGVECRPGFYPLELVWKHYVRDHTQCPLYSLDPVADKLWKHGVLFPTPYGLTKAEFSAIENIMRVNF